MPSAWRLTKTKYLSAAWDGEGARKAGGRWNSPGVAVVYTSGSLSLALVEVLVHLSAEILPAYSAVPIAFDESLVTAVAPAPAAAELEGQSPTAGHPGHRLRVGGDAGRAPSCASPASSCPGSSTSS